MEFQAAMQILHRLCADRKNTCTVCPMSDLDNELWTSCLDFMYDHPVEAEQILAKWAKEHPQKTMLQDFMEKYPNAAVDFDGTPACCASDLGYCNKGDEPCPDCVKCWNRLLEVEG